MRAEDLTAWFKLRHVVENPWEVVRFRQVKSDPARSLLVRMRDGGRLALRGGRQDFHVFHRLFVRDEYDLDGVGRLGTVLDIGANVGLFACRAAPLAERVVCYEPFPDNVGPLRRNTAHLANVEVVAEAVAGRCGTLRLFVPAQAAMSGRISAFGAAAGTRAPAGPGGGREVEVPAVDLATVLERHDIGRVDLLKIDVEGAEYDILHAAAGDVLARVDRIRGEYHDVAPDDPRTRVEAFRCFLEGEGYRVTIRPSRRKENLGLFAAERSAG